VGLKVNKKNWLISAGLCVTLGLGLGFTLNYGDTDASANATVKTSKAEKVEAALQKVPYKNKLKKFDKLPFEVKETTAFTSLEEDDSVTHLEMTYTDKNKKGFITLDVVNAEVETVSDKYDLVEVELKNGSKAKFMDNEKVQILSWQDGTLAYKIYAIKDMDNAKDKYSVKELVKLADSIK
jgi:hypothetical protein